MAGANRRKAFLPKREGHIERILPTGKAPDRPVE
jgi:hypothetical protein